MYKDAAIGDTVYFWFAANTTAGAAGDGATPLYDVRLAGAAAAAIPTASGIPTLLTHADYTDGLHEIAIDTTGWAVGEYAVFCTLTISAVNPAGFCGSFRLRAAGASLYEQILAVKAKTDNLPADPADDSDIDAQLATIAGYIDTEVAAILAAVDTEIAAIKAKTDLLKDSWNDISVANIIAGIADGSYDMQEMLRIIFSAIALKTAGGGTATLTSRDSTDFKNRIIKTVDANGNTTAVTLDGS